MRVRPLLPDGLLLLALSACALPACAQGGTAPSILLSTVLADGRTCRDASVSSIELYFGQKTPPRFVCVDSALPLAVEAIGLPLSEEVEVRGLSTQGAQLYRGALIAADVLDGPMPAVTVTLYPAAAR